MVRNLILDFDGVIRDYFSERKRALAESFFSVDGFYPKETKIIEILLTIEEIDIAYPKETMKWIVDQALEKLKISHKEKILPAYFCYLNTSYVINSSLANCIDNLLERYNLYIFTSNIEDYVREWLAYFSLEKYFIVFSTRTFGNHGKPSLSLLSHFLQSHSLNISESLYVGDDFVEDILPALALGLQTVHYSIHASNACNSFDDVLRIASY